MVCRLLDVFNVVSPVASGLHKCRAKIAKMDKKRDNSDVEKYWEENHTSTVSGRRFVKRPSKTKSG